MKKKKMIKLASWLGIVIMIIFYVVIAEYVDNKGTIIEYDKEGKITKMVKPENK